MEGTAPVKVEEGSIGLEKGPAGVEGVPKMEEGMAAAKLSQTAAKTFGLDLLFDGKKFSLAESGKEVEMRVLSYKVMGKEGNIVGVIVASLPIFCLEGSYAMEEPCKIIITMPELTGAGTFAGMPISNRKHILDECKVSSIEPKNMTPS